MFEHRCKGNFLAVAGTGSSLVLVAMPRRQCGRQSPTMGSMRRVALFGLTILTVACGRFAEPSPVLGVALDSSGIRLVMKTCTGVGSVLDGCIDATTRFVTVHRQGFSGDVRLSAEGLPLNVSASFTPQLLVGTDSVSRMSVFRSGTRPDEGVTMIQLHADAVKAEKGSATYPLEVYYEPFFTTSMTPRPIIVVAGQSATGTVVIARTHYPSPVTVGVFGIQPATGVTISVVSPNPTTGDQVTVRFDASATTAPGDYLYDTYAPGQLGSNSFVLRVVAAT